MTNYESTLMEDRDKWAKEYRSDPSLYLISALSMKYGIVIDCAIGAPGHGKDVVDGLNAVDKGFLRNAMFRLVNPEEDANEKSKLCHSATSLARSC